MSIYTSLTLTRGKAKEIVTDYIENMDDQQLKALVSLILEEKLRYNCYRIVENNEESDDERV